MMWKEGAGCLAGRLLFVKEAGTLSTAAQKPRGTQTETVTWLKVHSVVEALKKASR